MPEPGNVRSARRRGNSVNVIAGLLYAVAMPFVALTTAYVYFDARTRGELEAESEVAELPAEIELST